MNKRKKRTLKKLASSLLAVIMLFQLAEQLIISASAVGPLSVYFYARTNPNDSAYDLMAAQMRIYELSATNFFTADARTADAEEAPVSTEYRVALANGDLSAVPEMAGLKFAYWANNDGDIIDFNDFPAKGSTISLFAKYVPADYFSLHFDLNVSGGEEASLITTAYPDIEGFPVDTANLTDYKKDSGSGLPLDPEDPLYIAFGFFEGSVNMDHQYDQTAPNPFPRRNDGKVFTGWFWDTNATQTVFTRAIHDTAIDYTRIPENGIVTLYAGWEDGVQLDFDLHDSDGAITSDAGYDKPIIGLKSGWDIFRNETAAWYDFMEDGNPYKTIYGLLHDSLTDSLSGTSNYGFHAPPRSDSKVLIGWYTSPVTNPQMPAVIAQPGYSYGGLAPTENETLHALWMDKTTLYIDLNTPSGATVTNAEDFDNITGLMPYQRYGYEQRLSDFYNSAGIYSAQPEISGGAKQFIGWKYYSDKEYNNEIKLTSLKGDGGSITGYNPESDFYAVAQWGQGLAIYIDLNLPEGTAPTDKTLELYSAPLKFLSGESADTGSMYYSFSSGIGDFAYKPRVENNKLYFRGWTLYTDYDEGTDTYSGSYYQYSFYPMPDFPLYAVASWDYPVTIRFDLNLPDGTEGKLTVPQSGEFADITGIQPVSDPYSYIDYENGGGYSPILNALGAALGERAPQAQRQGVRRLVA
ncbi:MAG: hypothetical protein LBO63_02750 [Oscillospiraceae bacterium]|jgi:hypothetical protein|nr:hypothetical protein [Oscillospiraceae bacterium]